MTEELSKLINELTHNPIYVEGYENPVLRTLKILQLFGNPQNSIRFIQVVGTNGKGSTSYIIKSILQANKYRVGFYTSPHIIDFTERIKINDDNIDELDLIHYIKKVQDKVEEAELEPVGFSMCLTIAAILYFKDKNVPTVVLETGVGGLLDPTSAVVPIVQVITNIGLDHPNLLGKTIQSVAYHKLGVIKPNSHIVSGVKQRDLQPLIKSYSRKLNCRSYQYGEDFYTRNLGLNESNRFVFEIHGNTFKHKLVPIELNMLGIHQIDNTALALQTIEVLENFGYKFDYIEMPNVIKKLSWMGRMQLIKDNVLVDASHNVDGMNTLIQTLKSQFKNKKIKFMVSSLSNKEFEKSFKLLESVSSDFYFTTLDSGKALNTEDLLNIIATKKQGTNVQFILEPTECFNTAYKDLKEDELLVITGSFTLISPFLHYSTI